MPSPLSAEGVGAVLPDGAVLFESVDLSLPAGRTGLVGPNGSGKSTLLEILAGRRAPSAGRVVRRGPVAYLPQGGLLAPGETAADLAALRDAPPWRVSQALARAGLAGLDLGRRAASLSGGEVTRLRLAGLLLDEPAALLLDEPTNHLDGPGRQAVVALVTAFRGALLVATHDRALLAHVERIGELGPAGLRLFGGPWDAYRDARRVEREAAERAVQSAGRRLDAARRSALESAERQARRSSAARRDARGSGLPSIVAGARKRAAQVTAGRLRDLHADRVASAREAYEAARRAAPDEAGIAVDLGATRVPESKRLVEAEGVNVAVGDGWLWSGPLSFALVGPERVWLRGGNGSGKSTLLSLLAGRAPSAGSLRVGASRVARLEQDALFLGTSGTLAEALRRLAPRRPEHERRLLLGRFGFVQEAGEKPVAALSGGERIRAGLAALLAAGQEPELLLLDEPSSHLDLAGLSAVASALRAYRGALVLVTHDVTFAAEVGVTRELTLPPRARRGAEVRLSGGGADWRRRGSVGKSGDLSRHGHGGLGAHLISSRSVPALRSWRSPWSP